MRKYYGIIALNLSVITLSGFIYLLYIGSFLFIPFFVALLMSFIILSLANFFKKKGVPSFFSFIFSFLVIGIVLFLIGKIINSNINELITQAPNYEDKLSRIVAEVAEKLHINPQIVVKEFVQKIDIATLISTTASIITSIVKNAGIIFFFTLFILLESNSFARKLEFITGGSKSKFVLIFEQIKSDIHLFFWVKTVVSFLGALISLFIMALFQLDFLFFWTFLIFVLNFIPTFGSIIAVLLPVTFSLIQYGSFSLSLLLLLLLWGAQGLSGNFIEMKLMGDRLNLSPLVILISLIFWGTIWGPIGMLLCVPIMVTINIVLAHIPATQSLAIFLSDKGIIQYQGIDNPKNRSMLRKMKKIFKGKE